MRKILYLVRKQTFLHRRFLAALSLLLLLLLWSGDYHQSEVLGFITTKTRERSVLTSTSTAVTQQHQAFYVVQKNKTKVGNNTNNKIAAKGSSIKRIPTKRTDKQKRGKRSADKTKSHVLGMDGHTTEPYCAMHSSSFKYLIWPDSPSDFSDWTYKYKRKCPEFIVPDNMNRTKRLKYSLNCQGSRSRLVPSVTYKSDDIQRVNMNNRCLTSFIASCCNDEKGLPNIVHYVWYFNKPMKFYVFVSMVSIIRYVRPCLILFHGEYIPYGKYWDFIVRIYPNIIHVFRRRPLSVFGKKIRHHEHSGDIMRMDAIMKFGGIYLDTDVIILRDLEPLREFDATLCRQASGFLLNSFIMAKKNATFLTLWMEGYRQNFRNDSYVYNSMIYNNKLAYNRTDLIHVENGTLCSPPALIGKNKYSNLVFDWSKLYGYHIYARTIHQPWNEVWIKHYNKTVGAMVRQIIYGNKDLCEGPVHNVD